MFRSRDNIVEEPANYVQHQQKVMKEENLEKQRQVALTPWKNDSRGVIIAKDKAKEYTDSFHVAGNKKNIGLEDTLFSDHPEASTKVLLHDKIMVKQNQLKNVLEGREFHNNYDTTLVSPWSYHGGHRTIPVIGPDVLNVLTPAQRDNLNEMLQNRTKTKDVVGDTKATKDGGDGFFKTIMKGREVMKQEKLWKQRLSLDQVQQLEKFHNEQQQRYNTNFLHDMTTNNNNNAFTDFIQPNQQGMSQKVLNKASHFVQDAKDAANRFVSPKTTPNDLYQSVETGLEKQYHNIISGMLSLGALFLDGDGHTTTTTASSKTATVIDDATKKATKAVENVKDTVSQQAHMAQDKAQDLWEKGATQVEAIKKQIAELNAHGLEGMDAETVDNLKSNLTNTLNQLIDKINSQHLIDHNVQHVHKNDITTENVVKYGVLPLAATLGGAYLLKKSISSDDDDDDEEETDDDDDDDEQKDSLLKKTVKTVAGAAAVPLAMKAKNVVKDAVKDSSVSSMLDLNEFKDMSWEEIQHVIQKKLKDNNIVDVESAKKVVKKKVKNVKDDIEEKVDDVENVVKKNVKKATKKAHNIKDEIEDQVEDVQDVVKKNVKKATNKVKDMTSSSSSTTTNEIKQQFNKVLEQVAGTSEDRNGMIDASIKNILAGVLGVNLGANGEQIIAKIREKLTSNDDDDEDDDNEDDDDKKSSLLPSTKTLLTTTALVTIAGVAKYCHDHDIDITQVGSELWDEIVYQSAQAADSAAQKVLPAGHEVTKKIHNMAKNTTYNSAGTLSDVVANITEGSKLLMNKKNLEHHYESTLRELDETFSLIKQQLDQDILPQDVKQSYQHLLDQHNQFKKDLNIFVFGQDNQQKFQRDQDGNYAMPSAADMRNAMSDVQTMVMDVVKNATSGGDGKANNNVLNLNNLKQLGTSVLLDVMLDDNKSKVDKTTLIANKIWDQMEHIVDLKNTSPELNAKTQQVQQLYMDSKALFHDLKELVVSGVVHTPELVSNVKDAVVETKTTTDQKQLQQQQRRNKILASITQQNMTQTSAVALLAAAPDADETDNEEEFINSNNNNTLNYHLNYNNNTDSILSSYDDDIGGGYYASQTDLSDNDDDDDHDNASDCE